MVLEQHDAALVEVIRHGVGVVLVLSSKDRTERAAVVFGVQRYALATITPVVQAVEDASLVGAIGDVVLVEFDHGLYSRKNGLRLLPYW